MYTVRGVRGVVVMHHYIVLRIVVKGWSYSVVVYLHGALNDSDGHNGILQSDLTTEHQPCMSCREK